jgi:CRP/FNR family transcriptional regulator, cyclic AMP receptor protein
VSDLPRIRLLDADPDFGRFLTPDERHEAAVLTVPVVHAGTGPLDTDALLEHNGAFGAFIVEGMLACHLRVGEQAGMRVLGPGDILSFGASAPSMILVERGCRVVAPAQLALLGRDVLVGAHRWPRLTAGLHVHTAEQIERVAVQLAICQLPRVEDRLLALLWLLAESWGRVTPSGTALPINLTHETLGALVGARRPTVTLALGELTTRGALLRQGRTWLLLERPPTPTGSPRAPHAPELVAEQPSRWELPVADVALTAEARAEIAATVQRLRKEHAESAERLQRRLEEIRDARERNQQLRNRASAGRAVRPRRAPS